MGDTTRIPIRQVGASAATVNHAEHFYRRVPVVKPTYETDAGDLLPKPKKVGALSVGMADAEKLEIAVKESAAVSYEASERPTIRFRGKLAVSELEASMTVAAAERTEEIPVVAEEEVQVATAEEAEVDGSEIDDSGEELAEETDEVREDGMHGLTVEHLHGRAKMHKATKADAALPLLSNPDGVIGMQRSRIVDRNPLDRTLKVNAPLLDSRPRVSSLVITVVALASFVLAIGLVGLNAHLVIEANGVAEAYQFTFLGVIEMFKDNLTALLVHSLGR